MMTMRGTRRFAIGFFIAYAIAVVYPAVAPFRGPRPFILGLPFAMVWAAAWIVASFFVLLRLDRAYSAAERDYDAGWFGYDPSDTGPGTAGRPPGPHAPTPES
jgi:hypothetical protein